MYCTYLCYSALSSEPREYECNGLHKHSKAVSTGTLTLGLLTTVLSVVYSAVRAGSSTTLLSPPSSPRAGKFLRYVLKSHYVDNHAICLQLYKSECSTSLFLWFRVFRGLYRRMLSLLFLFLLLFCTTTGSYKTSCYHFSFFYHVDLFIFFFFSLSADEKLCIPLCARGKSENLLGERKKKKKPVDQLYTTFC